MRKLFAKLSVAAFVLALAAMPLAASAGTTDLQAASEDGVLVWKSADDAFKWWIDARAYIDMATYFDDGPLYYSEDDFADPDDWADYEDEFADWFERQNSLAGGVMLRRLRFAVKANLWTDWYSEIDLDFAEEGAAVKDAYISYNGLFSGNGRIRVGNFRQPFGLEEVTTSRNLMFLERSQGTDPFVIGRRLGLEVTKWAPKFRWSVSAFGGDVEEYVKYANEQVNFAARVNVTPIMDDESVLMIGGAATLRKPTFVGDDVKFNTRPETNVSDTKFLYAKYKDVDNFNVFGGELAYVNKRFMLQGEYMAAKVRFLDEDPDASIGGGYVFASFFLTDDTHKYDYRDAEFARVVPSSKSGAWEVAARYSTADLNDEENGEMGGKSDAITLGLSYYANANIKVMLNYGIVNNDENATGRGDYQGDYDFNYLSMRFLTAF
ncbi:MAG TPA: porin [Candidatus Krumholzibacteria bacterium]|nr:porin [Candidatus Krumholzibacteria bacterium]